MTVRSRRRTSALGRHLPDAMAGESRPKPVDHRVEKQQFAPPSIVGYCSRSLEVCYADRTWQIGSYMDPSKH